jgi:thiol-disulfide isomerase/thioredoxin
MAQEAAPEELLERLLDAGVLAESGDDLELTDSFQSARADRKAALNEADEAEQDAARETVADVLALDPEMVDFHLAAAAQALEVEVGFDVETAARVALSLKRFEGPPPEHGSPEGFTPITGEEIPAFLEENPAAVIYFWRENCPSCDDLRADLEELREAGEIPDDVALASVYGPGSPRFLGAEYDVVVAPTVLFCANSRVDARLLGVHQPSSYRREMEIVADETDFE